MTPDELKHTLSADLESVCGPAAVAALAARYGPEEAVARALKNATGVFALHSIALEAHIARLDAEIARLREGRTT